MREAEMEKSGEKAISSSARHPLHTVAKPRRRIDSEETATNGAMIPTARAERLIR
jgi:hypothetical protein